MFYNEINLSRRRINVIKKTSIFSAIDGTMKWVSSRIEKSIKKKKLKMDADVFANLEKLHRLKEQGIISDGDFEKLKEKLMERI